MERLKFGDPIPENLTPIQKMHASFGEGPCEKICYGCKHHLFWESRCSLFGWLTKEQGSIHYQDKACGKWER